MIRIVAIALLLSGCTRPWRDGCVNKVADLKSKFEMAPSLETKGDYGIWYVNFVRVNPDRSRKVYAYTLESKLGMCTTTLQTATVR